MGTVPSGLTIDASTGQISWAVPNELSAADSSFTITVRATEQTSGGSDNYSDVTIQVNVIEVNVAPVIGDGFYSVVQISEHLTVENQFTATDSDLPANDIVFSLVGNVPQGAVIDPATGHFTWTPGEAFGGTEHLFTVRATDSAGAYDDAVFLVEVAELDDIAPQINVPSYFSLIEGQQLHFQATGYDPDQSGDQLLFEIIGEKPDGLVIDSATGEVTWNIPLDLLEENTMTGDYFITIRGTEQQNDGVNPSSESMVRISVMNDKFYIGANLVLDNLFNSTSGDGASATDGIGFLPFGPFNPSFQQLPLESPIWQLPAPTPGDQPLFGLVQYGESLTGGGDELINAEAIRQWMEENGLTPPSEESKSNDSQAQKSTDDESDESTHATNTRQSQRESETTRPTERHAAAKPVDGKPVEYHASHTAEQPASTSNRTAELDVALVRYVAEMQQNKAEKSEGQKTDTSESGKIAQM